jgi:hypothetical protein
VKAFEKTSLGGEDYEDVNVNSKNCMVKSSGTLALISECLRLLERCVSQAKKGDVAEPRQALAKA